MHSISTEGCATKSYTEPRAQGTIVFISQDHSVLQRQPTNPQDKITAVIVSTGEGVAFQFDDPAKLGLSPLSASPVSLGLVVLTISPRRPLPNP
jgi:hypothetical protein